MNAFIVAVLCVLGVANAGVIAGPGIISSGIVAPIATRTIVAGPALAPIGAPILPASTILAGPSGAIIANRGLGLGLAGPIAPVGIASTGIVSKTGLVGGGLIGGGLIL